MTTRRVGNGTDSYTSSKAPSSSFYAITSLRVSAAATNIQHGFLYFTLPFQAGVLVQSAKLVLTQVGAHAAAAKHVDIQRIVAPYIQNRLAYSNEPGVTGATVVVNKGATPDGEVWEFDITALLQVVANGGSWYGLRAVTNAIDQILFHSMESASVDKRPYLDITWFDNPDQPDQLQPSGGLAVSRTQPTFTFHYHDPSGDAIQSVQLQVATTEALLTANTPNVWDSGVTPSESASLDSQAEGMPALALGTVYYWRVKVADNSGMWSDWSLPESFTVVAKGVLTATVDGASNMLSPIPIVDWGFVGQTQSQYQIVVVDADNKIDVKWDTGKRTSADTSVAMPYGIVRSDEDHFQFTLRIYDDVERVAGPGDPVYVEQVIDSLVAYDAAVDPVDTLGGTSDPIFPAFNLNFFRLVDPDFFIVQRKADGETAWEYGVELIEPADVRDGVDPTLFHYADMNAGMYQDFSWRVLAMVGGHQSDDNPFTTGSVRRLTTMLTTPDRSRVIALANPQRSRDNGDQQALVPVLAGPPVLFTQYIGGDQGHCAGILADDFLPGYTGKQMFEWFKWMRLNPGIRLKLYIADEALDVAIFNCDYDTLIDAAGLYYAVEFDWVRL